MLLSLVQQGTKHGLRPLLAHRMVGRRGFYRFADGGEHSTHNDLPIPDGDWYTDYKKRNAKYNRFVGSGIVATIVSIMLFSNCDYLFMNYDVPDYVDP